MNRCDEVRDTNAATARTAIEALSNISANHLYIADCSDDSVKVDKGSVAYNKYGLNLGFYGKFKADVLMPDYELPIYWMYRDKENFLVINPYVQLNAAEVVATGALFLMPIEGWFDIALTPMVASPIEYQASWSLDNPGHYC